MKKRKHLSLIPGLLTLSLIAIFSLTVHNFFPIAGAAVISMTIGMIIKIIWTVPKSWKTGMDFTSKKLLKTSIILMGANLNFSQLIEAGSSSLILMLFTLSAAFITAWIVGKYALGIQFNQRNLIAVGTGICGGSAIAALSPILEADDNDIIFAISATFLFDIFAVILFPLLGMMLGLSDTGYGLWAGTAVNDTSSVVAAGYAFSNKAGEIATMVKLARTTMLLPIGIILNVVMNIRKRRILKENSTRINIFSLIPWFVFIFIAVILLNTIHPFPGRVSTAMKSVSSFIITMALAAIGLNTDLKYILKTGRPALLLGAVVSLVVVLVSLLVQYKIGSV